MSKVKSTSVRQLPSQPKRAPTVLEVAELAGVSVGSVSRVINNNNTVLPKTRDRVLRAIQELGFQPNSLAQSMRQGATRAVGCIVSDVSQSVAAAMVGGAEAVFNASNYAMLVACSHYDTKLEQSNIEFFRQRKLDGLILTITNDQDAGLAQYLQELSVPIVLWERDIAGRFDTVLTDHADGTNQATRYLLSLGHKRILIVTGHAGTLAGREQERGYREAYETGGMLPPQDLVMRTGTFSMTTCAGILRSADRPTAIIANINEIPTILKAAKTLRLQVPHDLSVISIGDTELFEIMSPSITVVRGDGAEVGRTAANMLMTHLGGKASDVVKQRVVFPAELVVRASCAPQQITPS